jgi:glycerol-3-phosphate dehydrogenase
LVKSIKDSKGMILVMGGGATGIGIALEASARGYYCGVEKSDFTKSLLQVKHKISAWRCSILLRNVGLVREALTERGLLVKKCTWLKLCRL